MRGLLSVAVFALALTLTDRVNAQEIDWKNVDAALGKTGAVQGSVVATYLHGPCLARNPELADHLLSRVVGELPPLEIDEVAQLRRERLAAPRRV